MKRLLIIRHGVTALNSAGRTIAETDPPLSLEGHAQASALGRELARIRISRIYASPKLRARQTAEAVQSGQEPSAELVIDDRLREIGLGNIEGLTNDEIAERGLGEIFAGWRQGIPPCYPEGAETFEDVAVRTADLFERASPHADETVAIVGHSHSLRILIAQSILGVDPHVHRRLKLDHATVSVVCWENQTPRLMGINLPGSATVNLLATPDGAA